jgi:hypothetical protein
MFRNLLLSEEIDEFVGYIVENKIIEKNKNYNERFYWLLVMLMS